MRLFSLFILFAILSGCTVYQSNGRKYLDQHAVINKTLSLIRPSCQTGKHIPNRLHSSSEWIASDHFSQNNVTVWQSETYYPLTLMVTGLHRYGGVGWCTFTFAHVGDMVLDENQAVATTYRWLNDQQPRP